MSHSGIRNALIIALILIAADKGISQTPVPDILSTGTFKEQMNYIQDRTRIYENYRAIREDMFQKLKGNALDSLSSTRREIFGLNNLAYKLYNTIDSLNSSLSVTKDNLNRITETKNSIRLFGLEINKIAYNFFMWMLVAGLMGILVIGFIAFKRNIIITIRTKKELEELKNEFETYRKTAREAREKMSMAHFNELKKLKSGG